MEHALGNIFVRPNGPDQPGQGMDGHTHNFDHVTYVSHGSYNVQQFTRAMIEQPPCSGNVVPKLDANGQQEWHRIRNQTIRRGNYVHIPADHIHKFTSNQPTYDEAMAEIDAMDPAEVKKRLAVLMSEPSQLVCVYAHRTPQGNVVQEYTGWMDAVT